MSSTVSRTWVIGVSDVKGRGFNIECPTIKRRCLQQVVDDIGGANVDLGQHGHRPSTGAPASIRRRTSRTSPEPAAGTSAVARSEKPSLDPKPSTGDQSSEAVLDPRSASQQRGACHRRPGYQTISNGTTPSAIEFRAEQFSRSRHTRGRRTLLRNCRASRKFADQK
jgi:hypothetical protein